MPPQPFSREEGLRRVEAVNEAMRKGHPPLSQRPAGNKVRGAEGIAAEALNMGYTAFIRSLGVVKRLYGVVPDESLYGAPAAVTAAINPPPSPDVSDDALLAALRKAPATLAEIAERCGMTKGAALDRLEALQARGHNLQELGGRWSVETAQTPAFVTGQAHVFTSRADNSFEFGVMADSHLGSKYERLDALNDCYDQFAAAGLDRVYHCGNWIEGEARFNRTDLAVHGMDAQLNYLAKKYPSRPGITTYAVTGDDHEGWYAQREGIDIGRRAEQTMRDAGRTDWVNLGFMEAHVRLHNANTGKESILAVVHPGGGSSYAESYVVQKIIESLDGGEKPAVAVYGHYHKCLAGNYRNVWWILVPSTKDQDVFMRKKRLRSVVGGGIVRLQQDPETGAITRCRPDLWQYFNRGYYDGRWSHSGDVTLPERGWE